MIDALESGDKFLDIFNSPPTKFSKTNHLANTDHPGPADQERPLGAGEGRPDVLRRALRSQRQRLTTRAARDDRAALFFSSLRACTSDRPQLRSSRLMRTPIEARCICATKGCAIVSRSPSLLVPGCARTAGMTSSLRPDRVRGALDEGLIFAMSASFSLPVKSGMPWSRNGPLNTKSFRLAMVSVGT